MGRRVDWWDDPAAPPANSLRPSAGAFVTDDADDARRVLLIRRDDNGNWSMPGGAMDLGESLTQCAVRETLEETGIEVEVTGLGGIWTDPRHRIEYADGEVRQEFTVIFRARPCDAAQTPTRSSESLEVVWVPADRVLELRMDRSQRVRLEHLLTAEGPWFDPAGTVSEVTATLRDTTPVERHAR